MRKRTPRHAKPRRRWVGPMFALSALLLAFDAKKEMDAATAAQLAEYAAS